jgi:hypothetical protein
MTPMSFGICREGLTDCIVMRTSHDVHAVVAHGADRDCPSVRLSALLNWRSVGRISTTFDIKVMPLETIPNSYFLIFCCR